MQMLNCIGRLTATGEPVQQKKKDTGPQFLETLPRLKAMIRHRYVCGVRFSDQHLQCDVRYMPMSLPGSVELTKKKLISP
jgi:hypothetical protein